MRIRGNRRHWLSMLLALAVLGGMAAVGLRTWNGAGETARPLIVGVSNGFIGSSWRTQMIENIEKKAEEYKRKGWISELYVQNAGQDVNNQIAQIRNMIDKKVDLLLIDPNSESALNPVIEEAHRKGIRVITFDQSVTSPYALNVVIDQKAWGARQAQWLTEQLDGTGRIVIIGGVATNPANVDRLEGMKEVLARFPNIEVLAEENGSWDYLIARRVMADMLASYAEIDGVLTQDSMPLGVLNAYQVAGKKLPVVTGETWAVFLRKWKQLKDAEGFESFGQNNPPGIGVTALGIGVRLEQGEVWREPPSGGTFHYEVRRFVTNDNLEAELDKIKHLPDTYISDEWLSEQELDELFQ
jgi:ribose transport system substrate-binding protein